MSKVATGASRKGRAAARATGALFYIVLIGLILAAFSLGGGNRPNEIAGLSIMRVLSPSMKSVYPQGSIVLIKRIAAGDIEKGDDITFLTGDGKIITHRVEDIYENHLETGHRGFLTKGVNNPVADNEIVYGVNIIGRVIWHSNAVGQTVNWVNDNKTAAIIITAMIPLLIFLLIIIRKFFRPVRQTGITER